VQGLASVSALVSPASSEANHYKDIVSSVQGQKSAGILTSSVKVKAQQPKSVSTMRLIYPGTSRLLS
jgi:hypothetical protein